MTEFTDLYKTLSNSELLKIISESKSYKPLAIETAKLELENRQLSEEEMKQALFEITSDQQHKKEIINKRKEQEDKIKTRVLTFFNTISPIQHGIQTPEKLIRLIIIIFTFLSLYRLYSEFDMIRFLFFRSEHKWDLSLIEYFLPILLLPLATFLFWKRKKIGWILLSVFVTYSAISAVALFFINLGREPFGIPSLDSIFPTIPPITYIMVFIFYGGILWMMCKKKVIKKFQITNKTMWLSIGLTIVAFEVFIYLIME